jgi:hypothetical protein
MVACSDARHPISELRLGGRGFAFEWADRALLAALAGEVSGVAIDHANSLASLNS